MENNVFVCYTSNFFMSLINKLDTQRHIEGVFFHNYSKISREKLSNFQNYDNNILLFVPNAGFFENFATNLNALKTFYSDITVKRVLYLVDSFSMIERKAKLPSYYLLQKISSFFDNIYSFSMHDHFAYNFCFHPTISTKLVESSDVFNSIDQDVFFIGGDNGRINILLRIAKQLKEKGVSYKFIVRDPQKAGTNIDGIYFIDSTISYDEVINYVY